MTVEKTFIEDLLIITPQLFQDERGYFFESYNEKKINEAGINIKFIQDNQSFSKKGVIRGLHLQIAPFAQTKLVRVLDGDILDVAVDMRKNSSTFGKHFSIHLSARNKKQLLIPHGFAHGFSVLSDFASVLYKVDQVHHKESERGIRFDDPALGIDWKVDLNKSITSQKDLELNTLEAIKWELK